MNTAVYFSSESGIHANPIYSPDDGDETAEAG